MRAGLALVARVGRLESGAGALASRVGIATGLVVVGDLIGTGDAQERGVVGETPSDFQRRYADGAPHIPGCFIFMWGLAESGSSSSAIPEKQRDARVS